MLYSPKTERWALSAAVRGCDTFAIFSRRFSRRISSCKVCDGFTDASGGSIWFNAKRPMRDEQLPTWRRRSCRAKRPRKFCKIPCQKRTKTATVCQKMTLKMRSLDGDHSTQGRASWQLATHGVSHLSKTSARDWMEFGVSSDPLIKAEIQGDKMEQIYWALVSVVVVYSGCFRTKKKQCLSWKCCHACSNLGGECNIEAGHDLITWSRPTPLYDIMINKSWSAFLHSFLS